MTGVVGEWVHWAGEPGYGPTSLHGNGAASFARTSGDEDDVTCNLCQTLLARGEHRVGEWPPVSDAEVEVACEVMHDAYEAAAIEAGWTTQERSRVPWVDVTESNKATMRVAVRALIDHLTAARSALKDEQRGCSSGEHSAELCALPEAGTVEAEVVAALGKHREAITASYDVAALAMDIHAALARTTPPTPPSEAGDVDRLRAELAESEREHEKSLAIMEAALDQRDEALAAHAAERTAACRVLSDLDRCEHGRHEGDACGGCGDRSHGNPNMTRDRVIGHDISGRPYSVPVFGETHDPAAWDTRIARTPTATEGG